MVMRVFVDADVLYSRTLYDWLFQLRTQTKGLMFTLGTSQEVIDESLVRFRDNNPLIPGGVVQSRRERFVIQFDEVIEEFNVDPWMLEGDAGDAHVRAACVEGGFHFLVTNDKKLLADNAERGATTYEPITPDNLLTLIDDSSPDAVREMTEVQYEYFIEKHGEVDLPERLRAAGCPVFAQRVNGHLHAIHSD